MASFRQRLARRMGVTENLGVWDAATNSPTLTSGVGQTNGYYIVSTEGSTLLDGESDWKVGDWVYFTGTAWEKIDNTEDLGGSNDVGSITYISSIEQIEVIPADGGSMQQGISFNVNFSQPVPVVGDLYFLSTYIDSVSQTDLNNLLLYRDRFRITPETNQVSCLFTGVMPEPLVASYLVFVPVMDLGGGVEIKTPELLFKLATLTPQSLTFPEIFESSNYVASYLELELNSSDITSALYYKRSSQDLLSLQSNLEPRLTTVETELTSIEDSISNKLNTTGGTLTGPVTTYSHIFLSGGTSNNSSAAVSRENVQSMLTNYVRTVLAGDISGNQKNIGNLNRLGANEIGGVNLNSGIDVNASVLKTNTIKAPQSGPFVDTELTIKKADSDDPNQEMMKFFSYWPGNIANTRDYNGETASIIVRPHIRGEAPYTTSYNLIQTNSRVIIKAPINESVLLEFATEGGLHAGWIYLDQTTNDVVYANFCGSHPSQLITTEEIKLGSVMESLDEMCKWENTPEKRLPKSQLCLTEESSSVYGVFTGKDDEGDPIISAVGLSYCRIAPGVVVKKGDLLVSNGDGCARVQSDDIIRSKTIGKVVSATVVHSYEDGSYTVPVALYCG